MSGNIAGLLLFAAFALGPAFTWMMISRCDDWVAPQTAGMKVGAVLLGLAFALIAIARREIPWRRGSLHILVFLWAAWQSAGIFWAPARPLAVDAFIWTLCGIAIMLFAENKAADKEAVERALGAVALLATLFAVMGILQWFRVDWMPRQSYYAASAETIGQPFLRVYATFGNPNLLASLLAAALPAGVWLAFRYRTSWIGFLCAAGTSAQVVCLVLTSGRGAWLGAYAGLCVLLLVGLRNYRRVMLAFLIVVVFAPVAGLLLYHTRILGAESFQSRVAMWRIASGMAQDHPVRGIGPGQTRFRYLTAQREYFRGGKHPEDLPHVLREKPRHLHNDYLETLVEGGIVGLALLLLLIGVALRSAPRMIPAAAGIAAILGDMLFGFPLHLPATAMLFWLYIGLCSGASARDSENKGIPFPAAAQGAFGRGALIVIAALGAMALGNLALNPLEGRVLLSKSRLALLHGDAREAERLARLALRYDRHDGEFHFNLGTILLAKARCRTALSEFRRAGETSDDPFLHLNTARAHAGLGDAPQSKAEVAILQEMLPGVPVATEERLKTLCDDRK